MGLRDFFTQLTQRETETVEIPYSRLLHIIDAGNPAYQRAEEFETSIMAATGLPVALQGSYETRALYADPAETIRFPVVTGGFTPYAPVTMHEQSMHSSPAIVLHEYKARHGLTGVNLIMHGRLTREEKEPRLLFALHGMADPDTGRLAIKQLFFPVFDEYRCLAGVQRVPVTEANTRAACAYMYFTKQQIINNTPINARANLERAQTPPELKHTPRIT